jgi:hypothetical protein
MEVQTAFYWKTANVVVDGKEGFVVWTSMLVLRAAVLSAPTARIDLHPILVLTVVLVLLVFD